MLRRIIQAHGGTLPDHVHVVFSNTGKEMPQTLDFVRDCGERWGVPITWVEYVGANPKYRIVDHATASRNGEPFEAIIRKMNFLPNPVTRFCTAELKIRASAWFALSLGWENWLSVLGLRADEPRRVAKAKNGRDRWENVMPLATAGITKRHVAEFWATQNFGLDLQSINGTTPHGNCDLCFLKSQATVLGIMRDMPERAEWWIRMEALALALASKPTGAVFRTDRPSYAALFSASKDQYVLPNIDEPLTECFCHE
jgi:3'-phosphoadenosine 5'-phosphosulfate sulfotransferase (PAPS reductase)/FAD synthetase